MPAMDVFVVSAVRETPWVTDYYSQRDFRAGRSKSGVEREEHHIGVYAAITIAEAIERGAKEFDKPYAGYRIVAKKIPPEALRAV